MRIQNNIMALNAHRQYNINQSGIAKSTEKLSSGFRINRAGDDAAGLAISEKMRAQIRGLTMASKNSQDAISLVQTAEGALQETHNILQRMRELAVQSSSDSNETTIDRAALQQEYQNLLDEINDISTTTRFNDQNLLDGTFQKTVYTTNTGDTTLTNVNALSVARAKAGEYTMKVESTPASPSTITPGVACMVDDSDMTAMANMAAKVSKIDFAGLETADHDGNTYTLKVTGSDIKNMTFQLLDSNGDVVSTAQNVNTSEWQAIEYEDDGTTVKSANNSANVVSFKGVGSLTFTLDEAISEVTDLDTMSSATLTFMSTGTKYVSEIQIDSSDLDNTNTDLAALKGKLDTVSGSSNYINSITWAANDKNPALVSKTTSGTAVAPDLKLDYSINTDGDEITLTLKDADGKTLGTSTANLTELAAEDNTITEIAFDFGEYGVATVELGADLATKPTFDQVATYTHTVDAGTDITVTSTANMDADIQSLYTSTSGLTDLKFKYDATGAGSFTVTNTQASTSDASDLIEFAVEINEDGQARVNALNVDTGEILKSSDWFTPIAVTNTASATQEVHTFDLEEYGKFVLQATGTTVNADNDLAADGSFTDGMGTADAVTAGATTAASEADPIAAVTGSISLTTTLGTETEVATTGGKAQEATPAVRASMTLTINGESVVLHKGDTYANFADQGISFSFNALSDEDILNANYFDKDNSATPSQVTIAVNGTDGKSLIIQSGANQGDELAINVDRISTETLGLSYSNISTHEAASRAITEVNNAINQVSTQRAALGALQNRLDHKIANLDTSAENLTAAEARIRDVDMAKEMTNFTKNNILFQASTAMLAQANAAPQGVLQLLG